MSLPACSSPVFMSATARAEASARLSGDPSVVDIKDIAFASPTGHARLDAAAYAQSRLVGDDTQLQARMQVETWWNGPGQGSVMLDQSFGGVSEYTSGMVLTGGSDLWVYTFRVDQDARLLLRYDVDVDPATGGAASGGFRVLIDHSIVGEPLVGSRGVLDLELEAGETYTLSLGNILAGYVLYPSERIAAGYHGFFQWSIEDRPAPPSAVPEPAGVPLLALALVAAATARRRRAAFGRAR
ncbi:MAG: PEP-CTERM sorting domain-containing protein [Rubrivivax sp.]